MARTSLTLYIPAAVLYETTELMSRWADGVRGSDSWFGAPGGELKPALDITELSGMALVPAHGGAVWGAHDVVVALEVRGPEWALQDLLGVLSTGSDEVCSGVAVANAELAYRPV